MQSILQFKLWAKLAEKIATKDSESQGIAVRAEMEKRVFFYRPELQLDNFSKIKRIQLVVPVFPDLAETPFILGYETISYTGEASYTISLFLPEHGFVQFFF